MQVPKTSKYHRERAKFQPKSVPTAPCISCSKTPSARAHLIPVLEGRKRGIPMKFLNEDWNLVNLCKGCHLLLDNKLDWWANHERKVRYGVDGEKLLDAFRSRLRSLGIGTYDFDCPEEFDGGGADSFEVAMVAAEECHTYVATKWGCFGIEDESVEDALIEAAWSYCWEKLKVPSTKEYRNVKQKCLEEAVERRKALIVTLKDRIEAAEQKVNELLSRVRPVRISTGSLLNDLEVTGFDVTTLREGYITVFIFEPASEKVAG